MKLLTLLPYKVGEPVTRHLLSKGYHFCDEKTMKNEKKHEF